MPPPTKPPQSTGLLRATLTLLAGGALAQALPLLLGPWLTRLYTPQEFGVYHLFAAVAANFAVVGCARYEFALPLARGEGEAEALRALSLWVLAGVTLLALTGGVMWSLAIGAAWPLWLPLAVAALGGVSLATLWATRAKRFHALAAARAVQYSGAVVTQIGAGLAHAGATGLILGPVLAAALATGAVLRLRIGRCWRVPRAELMAVARQYRDFPILNTPHAFAGALQDTLSVIVIAAMLGPAAAGFWGLAVRYLKAPATLIGGAVSQALYPTLAGFTISLEARTAVIRVMVTLALIATPIVVLLWAFGPWAFELAFGGAQWREAGELARALALYVGVHFVASPLAVVTMAWQAQAWALRFALVGQCVFVLALALGLRLGGLTTAGWCVSAAMALYFGGYFFKLATWPIYPTKPEITV